LTDRQGPYFDSVNDMNASDNKGRQIRGIERSPCFAVFTDESVINA